MIYSDHNYRMITVQYNYRNNSRTLLNLDMFTVILIYISIVVK